METTVPVILSFNHSMERHRENNSVYLVTMCQTTNSTIYTCS